MKNELAIESATYASGAAPILVRLVLSDSTEAAIYLDEPRGKLHDLLDAWLAEGNEITEATT
jgi:hypothetical protein